MIWSIHKMDCIEGMDQIRDGSVDVCVTSPPYNLGIKYQNYSDNVERSTFLMWCAYWMHRVSMVLKPGGSFFVNVGGSPSNPLLPHELLSEAVRIFKLQNTFHWIKAVSIERFPVVNSYGHFKPINSERFVTDCHEYVFHLTKNCDVKLDRLAVGVPYSDKSNVKRWAHTGGKDLRCKGNVWFIPYKTITNRKNQRPHPASFPPELAEHCIKIHGGKNLTVMDPFLGIGGSAVAAKNLERMIETFIGFDIEEDYIQETKERIK